MSLRPRGSRAIVRVLGYVAMLLVMAVVAGPLLFVFFPSFKEQADIYSQPRAPALLISRLVSWGIVD